MKKITLILCLCFVFGFTFGCSEDDPCYPCFAQFPQESPSPTPLPDELTQEECDEAFPCPTPFKPVCKADVNRDDLVTKDDVTWFMDAWRECDDRQIKCRVATDELLDPED